jgi:transcriptional regulator with XRE-family HTH domain
MNHIGMSIEAHRRSLGLSRDDLAQRLGVTAQTVLNLERDERYNLGTRLLRQLEEALNVEFTISIKEVKTMNEHIQMGNDEFILHIRKNYTCSLKNPELGRRIWEWLRDNAEGKQIGGQKTAHWGEGIEAVSATNLPGSATQFEFRLDALPALFRFLGQLGQNENV